MQQIHPSCKSSGARTQKHLVLEVSTYLCHHSGARTGMYCKLKLLTYHVVVTCRPHPTSPSLRRNHCWPAVSTRHVLAASCNVALRRVRMVRG